MYHTSHRFPLPFQINNEMLHGQENIILTQSSQTPTPNAWTPLSYALITRRQGALNEEALEVRGNTVLEMGHKVSIIEHDYNFG
jgi:hypothetical protein